MNVAASVAASAPDRRNHVAALVFCLLWIIFWYRDTAMAMVEIWSRSETFTHGFVVPPITLWLILRQRDRLAELDPSPSPWALFLVACAGLLWLLSDLAAVNSAAQLALVGMLVSSVPLMLGVHITRVIAFPLGFLFFAVPIGEFALPLLMDGTANFTVLALRLSGIPVYREGLHFVIPSGNWSVVEACSGVRYLIASSMVGVLFAYLNYTSLKRRLLFTGVSLLVPIVANWLRAYMIVMLGHLSGNKLAVGVDHLIYGWLFFGLVIVLMFIIGARWAEQPTAPTSVVCPEIQPAASMPYWLAAALLSLLAVVPHLTKQMLERPVNARPPILAPSLADIKGSWQPTQSIISDWRPEYADPSAAGNFVFSDGSHLVGVYVGYYRNQTYDRKLVSSTNVLVSSQNPAWALVGTSSKRLSIDGNTLSLKTADLRSTAPDLRNGASRLMAWQIYWINGRLTASAPLARAYVTISRLLGQGDDSAVIVLYVPVDRTGTAEQALESFTTANLMAIEGWLHTTSEH